MVVTQKVQSKSTTVQCLCVYACTITGGDLWDRVDQPFGQSSKQNRYMWLALWVGVSEVFQFFELSFSSSQLWTHTKHMEQVRNKLAMQFSAILKFVTFRKPWCVSVCHRIMLALPSVSFVKVKAEGDGMYLDCKKLIQHVNNHQVCFSVTSDNIQTTIYDALGWLGDPRVS